MWKSKALMTATAGKTTPSAHDSDATAESSDNEPGDDSTAGTGGGGVTCTSKTPRGTDTKARGGDTTDESSTEDTLPEDAHRPTALSVVDNLEADPTSSRKISPRTDILLAKDEELDAKEVGTNIDAVARQILEDGNTDYDSLMKFIKSHPYHSQINSNHRLLLHLQSIGDEDGRATKRRLEGLTQEQTLLFIKDLENDAYRLTVTEEQQNVVGSLLDVYGRTPETPK